MRVVFHLLFLLAAASIVRGGGADWMAGLGDELPISRVTLPGTHDSGALIEPLPGTAKTQSVGIGGQLEFGVRLLDIRCRHVGDAFRIHHGMVDQKQTFAEVVKLVTAFLDAHPDEFVVMSVNQEFTPKDNTRSFVRTFEESIRDGREEWYLEPRIPKVGEVRGKIVLLRRFGGGKGLGLDASDWPDNRTFERNGLRVQDRYRVDEIDAKWRAVAGALEVARRSRDAGTIHLNFTSGVKRGAFGLPDITVVSDAINPRLTGHLEPSGKGFIGWLMMDFVTADLVELVFQRNDLREPG